MSVAERTRRAVRAEPFLLTALGAGVVNYSAAARWLDVEGDVESIATALRRFAEELDGPEASDRRASVRLHRRPTAATSLPDPVAAAASDGAAAIEVTGAVDALVLERVLGRLRAADVPVETVHLGSDALHLAVPGRQGADALRIVEDALEGP